MAINGIELIEKFEKLRKHFAKMRKFMPEVTDDMLCDEGDGERIYYMNANDGTEFDWNENGHLCEFCMFYKSTEMGFIKMLVNKDGIIDTCVFKEDYKCGDEPVNDKTQVFTEQEMKDFVDLIYQAADENNIWNRPISEIDFL